MSWALGVTRFALAVTVLAGCDRGALAVAGSEPRLTAGAATVFDTTRNAFSLPIPGLQEAARRAFFVGNSLFNQNWVAAPASVTSRDGLGPLFNARSCSGCHFKDGRGRPPVPGEPLRTMLVRISVPGRGPHGEVLGDPIYGTQLQGQAVAGVAPEADVSVTYEERPGQFADGTPYSLRVPRYRFESLGYGALSEPLQVSARVAPAVFGLGLLEAVAEADLTRMSDPDDRDGDGISGRMNVVWDAERGATVLGRFGWKAEQPSIRSQSAAAFVGDIGITSELHPRENHTAAQQTCAEQASGGSPELANSALDAVVSYLRTLAVPARRSLGDAAVERGERLFERAGCERCHRATLVTGAVTDIPQLSGQTLHAYTDLLLHDLGAALSDHRPVFTAAGHEWRTAPLWGIGLVARVNGHTTLLHDGRARDLSEAILWHGGEGARSREAFRAMSGQERADLLAFVESL